MRGLIKKITKFIIIFCVLIIMGISLLTRNSVNNFYLKGDIKKLQASNNLSINNAEQKKQEMKVLIIEINPTLKSITNKSLYPENNGHPKVSEYLGQDKDDDMVITEIVQDLEYASYGYLDVNIVKTEYLNEFPKYKTKVELKNGTKDYRLDEETYLEMCRIKKEDGTLKDVGDKGSWSNMINSDYATKVKDYSFDYEYIILR